MQFCHQRTTFLTLNLQFAYFVWSKMSVKGIIMFLGMNNTRLERKILIILDFENGCLPTYLPQCSVGWVFEGANRISQARNFDYQYQRNLSTWFLSRSQRGCVIFTLQDGCLKWQIDSVNSKCANKAQLFERSRHATLQ